MRGIKFRGKRIDNGEWVYGYYGWSMGKHYITIVINEYPTWNDPGGCYIENSYDVIPESVGQFTGLHDKNGKEIYEGDIINDKVTGKIYQIKFGTNKRQNYTGWYCEADIILSIAGDYGGNKNSLIEIIGSIYEHPELIENTPAEPQMKTR